MFRRPLILSNELGCYTFHLINHIRLFYYQVTKQRFFEKPTLHDFETAVSSLRALMEEAEMPCVGLPWLGCGRDRLDRSKVWGILHRCFHNSGIIVTVYDLPEKHIM